MNVIPKVGQRVRYRCTLDYPGATERTVTGIVVKNDWFPRRECLNDDELEADPDAEPVLGKLLPPSEQSVTVKVDEKPDWWPYHDTDRFCPDVKCLEAIE